MNALQPTAYTDGNEVILAKHWTGDQPPEGWMPLITVGQREVLMAHLIELNTQLRDARGTRAQLDDVVKFLTGEAALDGVWFGDTHPTERGQFWWRKHLRAAVAATKVTA